MPNIGELQNDLMRYEKMLRELQSGRDGLNRKKGGLETSRDRRRIYYF